MLGGLGNLAGIMKTAKDLQANLQKMQSELANRRYEGDAGGPRGHQFHTWIHIRRTRTEARISTVESRDAIHDRVKWV